MMDLRIININTKEGQLDYNHALITISRQHPYYTIDFIETFCLGLKDAYAFICECKKEGKLIIMPFYYRKITAHINSNLNYYDITSTYGYSGPLYNVEVKNEDLSEFWNDVDHWYRNNHVISEFIRFNLSGNQIGYTGTCIPTLKNIKGRLQDEEIIWKNYEHKVRKNVKKAIENNLQVKIYSDSIPKSVVKDFYTIYEKTMDRLKTKKGFYFGRENIINYIEQNQGKCAIAMTYHEEKPISVELILISELEVFSFLGGTDSEYFNLRPNDLLKHEIIKWSINHNYKFYVLGGGYGTEDGIYRYKKSFFPNDINTYYTGRKIIDNDAYIKLALQTNTFHIGHEVEASFFPVYRKE